MNSKVDNVQNDFLMDILEIQKYLPHRYPFLLVDRVITLEKDKSIVALKNLSFNEPFFQGHVPEQPIMPGVLMIEALAQASGILAYASIGRYPGDNDVHYLAGVDEARFKRIVVPGDQLQLRVEITRARRDLWKFAGEASVNGQIACMAKFMTIRVAEKKNDNG